MNYFKNISNLPAELRHFNYWMYSNKTTKSPCNKDGYSRSYTDTKNHNTFEYIINNNPKSLYYSFALMKKYLVIDIDHCFDEEGNLYEWAYETVSSLSQKGFYIEKSISSRGLHIFAKATKEILEIVQKLFNSDRYSIQINKCFEKYKHLNNKCKIEIFCNFIVIMTGDAYKSGNNPQNIKKADICIKNLLYDMKSVGSNKWHEKEASIDEIIKKDNDPEDVFNYIKYFVSIKQIANYYNIKESNKNISCPLPGHEDKKPSFKINYSLNLWYCYACKVGGTIIDLVMRMENFKTPLDAAKKICEIANLDIKINKKMEAKQKWEYAKKINVKKVKAVLEEDEIEIKELPWVLTQINENTSKITQHILPAILAEHIRCKNEYIFVKHSTGSILRYIYVGGVYIVADEYMFASIVKKYIPLELQRSKDIREVVYLLFTDINKAITADKLNPEKYINFQNGLLNIETWKMEPHSKEVLSTIQIPCSYKPKESIKNTIESFKNQKTFQFDRYMKHLSSNNEGIEKLLRQAMGLVISNIPGYKTKKAIILKGEHDTGKSIMKKLQEALIGAENNSPIDLEQLETKFGAYQIYNKRLVGSNDMSFLTIKEMKIFKMLTGGDPIFMEPKGKDGFSYKFNGFLWFCCNQLPLFKGDRGTGVYDRIVVIECNNKVLKKDKNLLNKMILEREYIVSCLIESLKEVIANDYNFDIPKECEFNKEKYQKENNSFREFFDECCVFMSDTQEDFIELNRADYYRYYCLWCKENNTSYPETKKEVKNILDEKGFGETKIVNGYVKYKHISIKKEILKEYQGLFEKFYPKASTYI